MTNKELIKTLVWMEIIIAMFIVTLILAIIDSFHVFTMFFVLTFVVAGFSFSVCEKEDEGQH